LQMNETCILITLLWMYIPRNWELGSALSKRYATAIDNPWIDPYLYVAVQKESYDITVSLNIHALNLKIS
jgi:hypothetical protein